MNYINGFVYWRNTGEITKLKANFKNVIDLCDMKCVCFPNLGVITFSAHHSDVMLVGFKPLPLLPPVFQSESAAPFSGN